MKLTRISFFTFLFSILCFSCQGNHSKKNDQAAADSTRITDSLFRSEKYIDTRYTFTDLNKIYQSHTNPSCKDTLPLGYLVFVDSMVYTEEASDYSTYYYIKYIKHGRLKEGVILYDDLAQSSSKSKKDSTLIFMAGYVTNADKESSTAMIKAFRNNRLVSMTELDKEAPLNYEISVSVMDSVSLEGTDELIFTDVYFPACGYTNTQYYTNYSGGKFQEVITTSGFADAPYFAAEDIYLPMKVKDKTLHVNFYGNTPLRDTLYQYEQYILPEKFQADLSKMIVIRFQQNGDSLDVNGEAVKDPEYDEPYMVITETRYTFYKWEGGKAVEIKP